MATKSIHIIGGGTVSHISTHFAVCASAYGGTARRLYNICRKTQAELSTHLHLTKMAGGGSQDLETNADIEKLIANLVADPSTKIVILTAAMCDFEVEGGSKHGKRFKTRETPRLSLDFVPTKKIVGDIRKNRKDIFAVAFKETSGDTPDQQYIEGLNLLKEAGVNLVLANDDITRLNMVITPEESRYHETTDRDVALRGLVEMALLRSQLTFTRSTVVDAKLVPWDSRMIPDALREVINYCIKRGAYKVFRGVTVGHFACKINENAFLSSIRKSNFNDIDKVGLVYVVTDGPDSVIAYGAKPSVGGQSQRIVFEDHKECDCIIHFHTPKRPGSTVVEVSQREYECGSMACGNNTSKGLVKYGNLLAVYLQEHGPNIVFHRSINPQEVIDFIEANFDLDKKTGGYVNLGPILT